MKQYWLVKSEPDAYSWSDLVREGKTEWTGVRNYTARNNLRAMQQGDEVLFYHSVSEKAVVGVAIVSRTAREEKTTDAGEWSSVELKPGKPLQRPVTLEAIRANKKLAKMALLRQSRLSVQPVTSGEFREILRMATR